MTTVKKIVHIKKREVIDNSEIIEKIDRLRNDQGYPIFNDYLLRKIFDYFSIADMARFSELCWKFRIFVTEKINRTWQYHYLIYTKQSPVERVVHSLFTWKKVFGKHIKVPTTQCPIALRCVDINIRTKHGYPGVYNWNTQQGYAGYNAYNITMATTLDQTTITESEVFPYDQNKWMTVNNFKLAPECGHYHALKEIPHPLGHRIYALKYDPKCNYYWAFINAVSNAITQATNNRNLRSRSNHLEAKIQRLTKEKEDIDEILRLKDMADERKQKIQYPASKMARFHMFRQVYQKKHNKYLTIKEASALWSKMSDDEKEKYADIADIQYEDDKKDRALTKLNF